MKKEKFHDVAELVCRLADQGKFKREKSSYDKPFGGVDDGITYVAYFEGRRYIIEEYVSEPEPMDSIQEKLVSYNLEVKSRGKTQELNDEEFEEEREKLCQYVAERTKVISIVKSRKKILDRMRA